MHSGEKVEEASASGGAAKQSRMDYLSVSGNEAANQLTVSSVTSGNLALYEVGSLPARPTGWIFDVVVVLASQL